MGKILGYNGRVNNNNHDINWNCQFVMIIKTFHHFLFLCPLSNILRSSTLGKMVFLYSFCKDVVFIHQITRNSNVLHDNVAIFLVFSLFPALLVPVTGIIATEKLKRCYNPP